MHVYCRLVNVLIYEFDCKHVANLIVLQFKLRVWITSYDIGIIIDLADSKGLFFMCHQFTFYYVMWFIEINLPFFHALLYGKYGQSLPINRKLKSTLLLIWNALTLFIILQNIPGTRFRRGGYWTEIWPNHLLLVWPTQSTWSAAITSNAIRNYRVVFRCGRARARPITVQKIKPHIFALRLIRREFIY